MKPAHTALKTIRTNRVSSWRVAAVLVSSLAAWVPVQAQTGWAAYNRNLEVSTGSHQQHYTEQDTQGLTTDGVLDRETGRQNHLGLAANWQTQNGWLLGVTGQRQTGATDYQGYLQDGNGDLRPYNSRTGNTATQWQVHIGYAINADTWPTMPASLQVTPLLQWGQHRWQRNLAQYSESYRFQTYALGAKAQWQAKPGLVLEGQILAGRAQAAHVSVGSFDFVATQPSGAWRHWQIGLTQDLGALSGKEALAGK